MVKEKNIFAHYNGHLDSIQDALAKGNAVNRAIKGWDQDKSTRYFLKDEKGKLICMSPNLLELVNINHRDDVIGLTSYALYARYLSEKFRQDDYAVLSSKIPRLEMLELFLDDKGSPEWYITSKSPVISQNGEVIGLVGSSRKWMNHDQVSMAFAEALGYIKTHLTEKISHRELVYLSCLSPRQFERVFKNHFHVNARHFILQNRILAACDKLVSGNRSISEIAFEFQFSDESHFIRHFKKHIGITPNQYRIARGKFY